MTCGEVEPSDLGFDSFYVHYCDAAGIPVLGSASVERAAVEATAEIALAMIGHRPDVIAAMLDNKLRIGVIAATEVTSDMPEYSNIYDQFPGIDWDTRARGLGATPFIPLSTVGEENVLCLPGDRYKGESIMVHEFAHTIHVMGLDSVDRTFTARLESIYEQSLNKGLWADTYAGTNASELFAEGVQSYFNTNLAGPAGGDGIHNDIDTRGELGKYHPALVALINEIFSEAGPLPLCG